MKSTNDDDNFLVWISCMTAMPFLFFLFMINIGSSSRPLMPWCRVGELPLIPYHIVTFFVEWQWWHGKNWRPCLEQNKTIASDVGSLFSFETPLNTLYPILAILHSSGPQHAFSNQWLYNEANPFCPWQCSIGVFWVRYSWEQFLDLFLFWFCTFSNCILQMSEISWYPRPSPWIESDSTSRGWVGFFGRSDPGLDGLFGGEWRELLVRELRLRTSLASWDAAKLSNHQGSDWSSECWNQSSLFSRKWDWPFLVNFKSFSS